MHATWKPHPKHGDLTERSDLPDSVFAFLKQRKEPLTDASHVRKAIARFDQTIDVSHEDRELAFPNIKKAAEHYGVDMPEAATQVPGEQRKTAKDRRAKPPRRAKSTSADTTSEPSRLPTPAFASV